MNGSVRTTRDLDICYARTAENHRRLAAALAPFRPRPREFPADLPFIWDAATLNNGTLFILSTTLGAIDLLAEVSGLGSYRQVKASAKLVEAFDRSVWTLDLRGVIDSKRAAGRPRDLEALPESTGSVGELIWREVSSWIGSLSEEPKTHDRQAATCRSEIVDASIWDARRLLTP